MSAGLRVFGLDAFDPDPVADPRTAGSPMRIAGGSCAPWRSRCSRGRLHQRHQQRKSPAPPQEERKLCT